MTRSGRGKRRPSYDGSTTAVLQGTHNSGDPPIFSPGVGETVEGGSDEKRSRARIFDHKRVSIIGVILAIIIFVAAVSSIGFAKPPSNFSTSTSTPAHPTEDGVPHLHKYAYVFVAYEQIGYAVAHQLYEQLEKSLEGQDHLKHSGGGHLKEQFIDPFNMEKNCTSLNLESSTVTILESPEFHCNMQKLRSLFMDHKDLKQEKWGVKLIHLVRNPFSMAISNYQDRKSYHTPEEVRFKNPCSSLTQKFTSAKGTSLTVADLNSPILSEHGIMTHEDFDKILAQCNDMFQTQPGLESASYHQHLEELPPANGLKLAVADRLNSIALMASDLISFKQIHALVQEEASNPKRKKIRHLDMMTLPLDEVLNYPGHSMMEFMDFVFGPYMAFYSKRKAAADFEHNLIGEDFNDAKETVDLIGFLENDPLFGGPLTRVESLLDSVLSGAKE